MYCRECMKKEKKVNMSILVEEGAYVCPSCGNRINWGKKEEEVSS